MALFRCNSMIVQQWRRSSMVRPLLTQSRGSRMIVFVLAVLLLIAGPASAVPITIDDFEDGTTEGWHVGDAAHPSPPVNIPSGGPAGIGDAYLQLTANGGQGMGSRLSVLNLSQWTGDFTGVSGISMDVNDFGPSEVVLRLLFANFPDAPGPPTDVAVTVAPVIVPAGSGWTSVFFSLAPDNLIAPIGTVAGALAHVEEMRIFHNPIADFPGPPMGPETVIAIVGIDNIQADIQAVPEPASVLLVLSGLGAAVRRWRRRTPR
jgi:hypothetical protein